MRCRSILLGLFVGVMLACSSSTAQYTANFQTNIIDGVVSNWADYYFIGSNTFADALVVQNGGFLNNSVCFLGYEASSTNNSVLVTGTGSIWSNQSGYIGYSGAGNSLVIRDGGRVRGITTVGMNSSSSNNHVLVSDPGSVWSNIDVYVGRFGSGNSLVISNGGRLVTGPGGQEVGGIGWSSGGDNSMVVSDTGSVWYADFERVSIGGSSPNNSLSIRNGGQVIITTTGTIGASSVASNNSVLVTGAGSVLSNKISLTVGGSGSGNNLVITNHGQVVVSGKGVVGGGGGGNTCVRVVDGGSWQNGVLVVGGAGTSNSLVIDGGSVYATNLTVGMPGATCDNFVELDDGALVVTNTAANAVLKIGGGALTVNGGVLQVNKLVMANACARFFHTGGTVVADSVELGVNPLHIISIARQGNDMLITWMMGPGISNVLQVASGDVNGNYTTNGFTDVFVVTNNPSAGTVTNYLDVGATNGPTRYYRARLVP